MRVVKVCQSKDEALLIKSLLDACDIPVTVQSDDMGLKPYLSFTQAVKVLVKDEQAEEAILILEESQK